MDIFGAAKVAFTVTPLLGGTPITTDLNSMTLADCDAVAAVFNEHAPGYRAKCALQGGDARVRVTITSGSIDIEDLDAKSTRPPGKSRGR